MEALTASGLFARHGAVQSTHVSQCCRDCIVLYAEPTRNADFCQSPEDVCTCLQKMSRPLAGSLKPQTLFDCEVLHPGIRPEACSGPYGFRWEIPAFLD